MASKGKPKHDLAPGPAATAVVEEAMAGEPPAAAAPGSAVTGSATSAEGDQAAAPPSHEQSPTPLLPTHLEPSSGPLPPEHTPEEAVGVLNGLVAQGVIDQDEFNKLYLRELEPLGATQDDVDRHWAALQERLQAERAAAEELAARMLAEAAEPPGIRPWNPLEDPDGARAEAEQLRHLFNGMVQAVRKERIEAGSPFHTDGYLKDRIAKTLSQRAGLSYQDANSLVHSWAGTSSEGRVMSAPGGR